jgi:hypothetical protein
MSNIFLLKIFYTFNTIYLFEKYFRKMIYIVDDDIIDNNIYDYLNDCDNEHDYDYDYDYEHDYLTKYFYTS